MFRKVDRSLKRAGVVQSELKHEEVLDCGFIAGLWWRYEAEDVDNLGRFERLLAKISTSLNELPSFGTDREQYDEICRTLNLEREGLENWFKLGFWVCGTTAFLGTERYANTTEEARALFRADQELRSIVSNFFGSLQDIGWSPDEIEDYAAAKLVPFLYDEGHRKWVDRLEMGVMSDLRFKAKEIDATLSTDSDSSRLVGSLRALISEIPILGKSLEILLFGYKNK